MTSATQGPYAIQTDAQGNVSIVGADGTTVANIPSNVANGVDRTQANATLLSKSPDMLALLDEVQSNVSNMQAMATSIVTLIGQVTGA